MTLPFRRRHHDDEAGHDRARSLASQELLEPLADDESAWLEQHLAGCGECRRDGEAFRADHELLRSLRERAPEPPRDLWARTAAALDREGARGRRRAGSPASGRGRPTWPGLHLRAAAGALIVLVVIGTAFIPGPVPPASPGPSAVAQGTPLPEPTQITVAANPVGWLRSSDDGSWELFFSDVDAVCPLARPSCVPPIDAEDAQPLSLGGRPSAVTVSPDRGHLVFESGAESGAGRILVVPLSETGPTETDVPTPAPASPDTSPTQPSADPATPEPSPVATPPGQVEIATGVTIVGDVAYSADGTWLAFSARPIDGSTGPDLYIWSVGAANAVAVTSDHRTYFSTWHGNHVLASTIDLFTEPAASGEPTASTEPPASEEPVAPVDAHPRSFVLDPATLTRTDLTQPDVWLPVVDRNGRFVAYWSGTVSSADGFDWQLGSGQLVLDRWSSEPAPEPVPASADPAATPDPAATAAPSFGPQGVGVAIVTGQTGAFKVRFDPDGTRLAVWVAESPLDVIGRLSLLAFDPETGALSTDPAPLAGEPSLGRFSIDVGRLAWVSPSGQDGEQSAVKVLGWSKNDHYGEIQTLPGGELYIVN